MRRTSAADLLIPFVLAAGLVYALLRISYESLPPFQWFTAVPLAALAVVELVVARRVRAAVRHHPQARPMTALAIARAVALGKATALVAAVVAGAAVALVVKLLPSSGQGNTAGHDLRVGYLLLVVSAGLLVAGLVLERAGIDPGHRAPSHAPADPARRHGGSGNGVAGPARPCWPTLPDMPRLAPSWTSRGVVRTGLGRAGGRCSARPRSGWWSSAPARSRCRRGCCWGCGPR